MCTYRPPESSGPAGGFGGLERAFSLRLARSRRQKKISQGFALDFRVLSLEHGRPGSIFGVPDALGRRFGSRNTWIFDVFPNDEAARSKITLIGGNHRKNCGFRSIEPSEKRCKHAFDEPWRQNESRSALYSVPGRPRTRFRTHLGSSWGVRGVPRSLPGRFLAVPNPSRARPDASLKPF